LLYRYKGNHKYENKCRSSLYAYRVAVSFLLTVVMCIVFGVGSVQAVLGPVHVELNITGERLGHARANTPTAFKIYMRVNEDIHTHDWVKVWFPTQEASDEWEDVCGEEFVIKGHDESPRFVPNEKYFEKYDNPEEERVGKLYEILDEHEVTTDFFDCSELCNNGQPCRLVEDPSGLGCWIMGTVLPALPRDRSDRMVITMKYVHACSPGYNPCCECMGYPIMIQDEKRCLFQLRSPVHVESWRQGYNPIDLNVSKILGIISPATPGRYKIRVATEPEPTHVESDAFVLPCSQITKPTVDGYYNCENNRLSFDSRFTVGEGGALDAGASTITFTILEWLDVSEGSESVVVYVNGRQCSGKLNKLNGDMFTVVTPVDVDPLEEIDISIVSLTKQYDIGSGSISIGFMTSSEPEMIESKPFIIDRSYESSLIKSLEIDSLKYGDTFACSFILDAREMDIDLNTTFRLVLPPGMRIPEDVVPGHFLINECSPKDLKRLSSVAVSFKLSEHARLGEYQLRSIRFVISPHAGIRNPNIIGLTTIKLSIDGGLFIRSEPIHFID